MDKPREEDSKEQKEVKLSPRRLKVLLDHVHHLEKMAGQIHVDSEKLTLDARMLVEEIHLINLITGQPW